MSAQPQKIRIVVEAEIDPGHYAELLAEADKAIRGLVQPISRGRAVQASSHAEEACKVVQAAGILHFASDAMLDHLRFQHAHRDRPYGAGRIRIADIGEMVIHATITRDPDL